MIFKYQINYNDKLSAIGIDLLLLSMGDVSIVTYGSYGTMGGILTKNKDVFYPKGHFAHNETQLNSGRVPHFYPLPWSKIKPNSQ